MYNMIKIIRISLLKIKQKMVCKNLYKKIKI